jgi:outer membrane protein TolC
MTTRSSFQSAATLSIALLAGCAADLPDPIGTSTARDAGFDVGELRAASPQSQDARVAEWLERELTVDDAVRIALVNNRRLRASFDRLGISQAELRSASTPSGPGFHGSVLFVEQGMGHMIDLSLSQNLIDLILTPARRTAAKAGFEAARFELAEDVLALIRAAKLAHLDMNTGDADLLLRREMLEIASASHDVIKRLYDAGNVTEARLLRSQASLEQARLAVSLVHSRQVATREKLNALMGVTGTDAVWYACANMLPVPDDDAMPGDVERAAVESSLMLRRLAWTIEQAGRGLSIEQQLGWLGGIEVGVAAEREPDHHNETWGEWKAGPSIGIAPPLDLGGSRRAKGAAMVNQLENLRWASAVELRAASRALTDETINTRRRAAHARDVIEPLGLRIVEATLLEHNAMQADVLKLLDARRALTDARVQKLSLYRAYWQARIELDHTLAGGSPRALPEHDAVPTTLAAPDPGH